MKRFTKLSCIFFLSLLFFLGLTMQAMAQLNSKESDVLNPSVRIQSMGGSFTALADDENVLYYNPAGIANITDSYTDEKTTDTFHIPFFEIGLNLGNLNTITQIRDFVGKMPEDTSQMIPFIKENLDFLEDVILNLNMGNSVFGPLHTGFVGKAGPIHFGLKLFSYIDTFARVQQVGFLPAAEVLAEFTKGIVLSVGHHLPVAEKELYFGANVKFFNRFRMGFPNLFTTELLAAEELLDRNPAYAGNGFGVDIGAMYQIHEYIRLALTVNDIFGSSIHYKEVDFDDYVNEIDNSFDAKKFISEVVIGFPSGDIQAAVRPTVNFGFLFMLPKIGEIDSKYISDVYLTLDIRDVIATGGQSNFFNRVHIGGEISFLRGILNRWIGTPIKVRMGINNGYFTCGIGATFLYVMHLDFGYWQEELGFAPGQLSSKNVGLTMKIQY